MNPIIPREREWENYTSSTLLFTPIYHPPIFTPFISQPYSIVHVIKMFYLHPDCSMFSGSLHSWWERWWRRSRGSIQLRSDEACRRRRSSTQEREARRLLARWIAARLPTAPQQMSQSRWIAATPPFHCLFYYLPPVYWLISVSKDKTYCYSRNSRDVRCTVSTMYIYAAEAFSI